MLKLMTALAALLIAAATAGAATPELKTDEQKTLYALGLLISQNLATFNLNEAEIEIVKAGLTDGVLGRDKKVELQTYGPKVQGLQQARASALAANEKKAGTAYLAKAAAEKGATKTSSGLILTTIKPGRRKACSR
jgi:FKBP-type peptidyl-prolyl cis-trans isomerase FkpA/FKBP-type peptidyl-prolyl cis-trans isomerase FklB